MVDAKRKLKDSRNDKHPEKAEGTGLLEGLCAEKARRLPSFVTASGAHWKCHHWGSFSVVSRWVQIDTITVLAREPTVSLWNISARLR